MIQIYKASNTDYTHNGDMTLWPTSCTVSAKLNGKWELTMEHPLDAEGRWKVLEEGAVLVVPSFNGSQKFRIYRKIRSNDGVTAYARPVFLDAQNDCILLDVRPTDKTGQEALDVMTAGTPYSGKSDITDVSTAYYIRRNLIEAINGKLDQSFVGRWGGEIIYDNYTVHINKRAGADRGLQIRYGLNLQAIKETTNVENVVTRIIPVAYNGYTLAGAEPWVDSPLIDQYPIICAKVVEFSDVKLAEDAQSDEESFDTLEELRAELVRRSEAMYSAGSDKPEVSMRIDMVDLSRTTEYREYKDLVSVSLGDTVHCTHDKLGITSDARVTALEWDCILETPGTITLGASPQSYFDKVTSIIKDVNNVITPAGALAAEKVAGILDAMQTQLRAQRDITQKQDIRALLFEDLDPESPTYGAMALGTAGFEIASERTADGKGWNWTTFGTGKGFSADYLIGGILISQNYEQGKQGFKADLNTGTLEAPSLKADITDSAEITIKETADSLSDEISGTNNKINDLSQQVNANASTFQQFADSINATIISTMLASGEWDGLLQQMTAIKATADGLSVDVSSLTNNLDGFITEYHTYFAATAEGLRISKSGSQFATLLSDTKLSFIQAGQEVAYIQYNRLYITEAWVKSGLSIESASGGSYIRQYVDSNNVFCIQSMEMEG